jgi:hypothetical protein
MTSLVHSNPVLIWTLVAHARILGCFELSDPNQIFSHILRPTNLQYCSWPGEEEKGRVRSAVNFGRCKFFVARAFARTPPGIAHQNIDVCLFAFFETIPSRNF